MRGSSTGPSKVGTGKGLELTSKPELLVLVYSLFTARRGDEALFSNLASFPGVLFPNGGKTFGTDRFCGCGPGHHGRNKHKKLKQIS